MDEKDSIPDIPVEKFNFISGDDFRASLESDYAEMVSCMKGGLSKSACVLAGSIIETVLIDYLLENPKQEGKDPLKMNLGEAIEVSKKKGIISEECAQLGTVVKNWRNMIHPGRSIRLQQSVDQEISSVAAGLVSIILKEVAKRRSATYGYTAEQIATKLIRDPQAVAILSHLLRDTKNCEKERLLTGVLKRKYLEIWANELPSEGRRVTLRAIERGFRTALAKVPDEVKGKVAGQFVTILKEGTQEIVTAYGNAFFRAADLEYLPSESQDLVKDHLFARLATYIDRALLKVLSGIGKFLSQKDVRKFVDPLMPIVAKTGSSKLKDDAIECLWQGYCSGKKKVCKDMMDRLDFYIRTYERDYGESVASELRHVKEVLELPF